MKFNVVLTISFFLCLIGCASEPSNDTVLKGSVNDDSQQFLTLSKLENVALKKYQFIDTIQVNATGEFEYLFEEEPGIYQLKSNNGAKVDLAINLKEQIVIELAKKKRSVKGSKDTDLLNDYESFRQKSLSKWVFSVRKEIKELIKNKASEDEIIEKRAEEVKNYGIHLDELAQFASENLKNSLALIPTSLRWNTKNFDLYSNLTLEFKHFYGDIKATGLLEQKINLLERTNIGARFPEVSLPSLSEEIVTLETFNSELTLIDFWASWCPPCRVESKLLNELFSAYSRNDFNIYGISLDTNKSKWENALNKDLRIWQNVSTLKGLKTEIAVDLGITALPFNFLLNKKGEIVASNIHGEALQEFISNYLESSKSL